MKFWAFQIFAVRTAIMIVADLVRRFLFEFRLSSSRENKVRGWIDIRTLRAKCCSLSRQ